MWRIGRRTHWLPSIHGHQGRKSSWGELTELNWPNWTQALCYRAPNWTERSVRWPEQADELNWTNCFTILKLIFVTPTPHHTSDKQARAASKVSAPSLHTGDKLRAGCPGFPREGTSNRAILLLSNNWRLDCTHTKTDKWGGGGGAEAGKRLTQKVARYIELLPWGSFEHDAAIYTFHYIQFQIPRDLARTSLVLAELNWVNF